MIDRRVSAALCISSGRLCAAWRTDAPGLLANDGDDYRFLFKRGGALDLMLATKAAAEPGRQAPTAGDQRLLVTHVRGQTKAVLYRAVSPGGPAAGAVRYTSPVGEALFDQVVDVSGYVHLAKSSGSYEVSIPLAVLGLPPQAGRTTLGDIGILRGTGTTTTQRVYWNNLGAATVSDIPSEARLSPADWGTLKFQ